MSRALLDAVGALLSSRFPGLSKPLQGHLAQITVAFVSVLSSVRGGQGRLTLASLIRALPVPIGYHSRENRVRRLLTNRHLDFRTVTGALSKVLLAGRRGFAPVLLDQTKSGTTQALVAAVPFEGRALPVGACTFDYPLVEPSIKSQNLLEHVFLLSTEEGFPRNVIPVWIADRGYARAMLLEANQREGRLYVIRGRGGTVVRHGGERRKLHQLSVKAYRAILHENVEYQSRKRVRIDVVTYWEPGFAEPWHLLVPIRARSLLSPDQVVALYRERMQIEHSFRDFKTHLGLRGLRLESNIAERIGRLLVCFFIAYILCVLIGASELGEKARTVFEHNRRNPRHGTNRVLSPLFIAMLMLTHHDWLADALRLMARLLLHAAKGRPWLTKRNFPMPLELPP